LAHLLPTLVVGAAVVNKVMEAAQKLAVQVVQVEEVRVVQAGLLLQQLLELPALLTLAVVVVVVQQMA
jgi:hypothetical protein